MKKKSNYKILNLNFDECAPPIALEDSETLYIQVGEVEEALQKSIVLVGTQVREQVTDEEYLLIGQVVSHLCTFIRFELIEKGLN